jgi:hypothetical protein
MANNVQKWVTMTGEASDLNEMYEALDGADYDMGNAIEKLGGERQIVDNRGGAEIACIILDERFDFAVITPYGNMTDIMEFLRWRFPKATFVCYNENDEENEFD